MQIMHAPGQIRDVMAFGLGTFLIFTPGKYQD
jgi:hypothetical protein